MSESSSLTNSRVVNQLIDAFEEELWSGSTPSIEEYLEQAEANDNRRRLLRELILLELDHSSPPQRQLDPQSYHQRFPGYATDIDRLWADRNATIVDGKSDGDDSSTQAALPRTLGRFHLLEEIGRGTFGTVYRSLDTHLDRIVAVKIAHQTWLSDPESEKRLIREARNTAQLHHPGIVTVFDAFRQSGHHLIVTELVDGQTLADAMSAKSLLIAEVAVLVAEIADVLQYAHDHGVVHRDLKPSNIMLGSDGKPRVMDFGLAKRCEIDENITLDGQLIGTPAYMSPEQAAGKVDRVDHRSDVYSLGVILFELLTGELPFRGNQRMILRQVVEHEPRQPRSLNDRVPTDLQTICATAMNKEVDRRYATAADFAADLRRWIGGEPIQARPIGRAGKAWRWAKRHPEVSVLAASVVLLMVAISVVSSVAAVRIGQVAQRERESAAMARAAERREQDARLNAQHDRDLARQAQNHAESQQDIANQISTLLIGLFKRSDPLGITGGPRPVAFGTDDSSAHAQLLTEIAERIQTQMSSQPEVQVKLLTELGDVHRSRAEYDLAAELIDDAERLWIANDGEESLQTRIEFVRARLLHDLGEFSAAADRYRAVIREQAQRIGRNHPDTATTLLHYAWLLADVSAARDSRDGRGAEIESIVREVLQIRREHLGDSHRDTALAMTGLLAILAGDGREEEAKDLLGPALQIYNAQPGGQQVGMALSLFLTGGFARNKGDLEKAISDYEKAIEIGRQILGDFHPILALCLGELAGTYKQAERFEEAEAAILEALDIAHAITKKGHPAMIPALVELADWRFEQREFVACEKLDLEAIRIWKYFRPCGHEIKVGDALLRRGHTCYARGMFAEAKAYYQQTINCLAAEDDTTIAYFHTTALLRRAQAQRAMGELELSCHAYESDRAGFTDVSPDDQAIDEFSRYLLAVWRSGYTGVLIDRAGGLFPHEVPNANQAQLISKLVTEGLTYQHAAVHPDPIAIGENFFEAARWELIQGNVDQATEYAGQSIHWLQQRIAENSWVIAAAKTSLAACLIKQQRYDEAQSLLAPAIETLTKTLGTQHDRTKESRRLLAQITDYATNAAISKIGK